MLIKFFWAKFGSKFGLNFIQNVLEQSYKMIVRQGVLSFVTSALTQITNRINSLPFNRLSYDTFVQLEHISERALELVNSDTQHLEPVLANAIANNKMARLNFLGGGAPNKLFAYDHHPSSSHDISSLIPISLTESYGTQDVCTATRPSKRSKFH